MPSMLRTSSSSSLAACLYLACMSYSEKVIRALLRHMRVGCAYLELLLERVTLLLYSLRLTLKVLCLDVHLAQSTLK